MWETTPTLDWEDAAKFAYTYSNEEIFQAIVNDFYHPKYSLMYGPVIAQVLKMSQHLGWPQERTAVVLAYFLAVYVSKQRAQLLDFLNRPTPVSIVTKQSVPDPTGYSDD